MKQMTSLLRGIALTATVFSYSLCFGSEAKDTIRVTDFGVRPGTYENSTVAIQRAIDSCREHPGCVLQFAPGRYDIWPEGAVRKEIYVSNTSSEVEMPSKVKTIGMHFYGLENVTVSGEGVTLIMHGSMTPIAIDSCRNVSMSGFTIDFERPGGSELTYIACRPGKVTVKAHRDTRYEIVDRRLQLFGEGWRTNIPHCIKLTPSDGHFMYSNDWKTLSACDVEEIEPGILEFTVPDDFHPETGATLTIRDIIRREVGMLNIHSSNTYLHDMAIRYMHGLGIVSQYSTNITYERLDCSADPSSGRILASSADFTHFSGCRGHIEVKNCKFIGAQDDAINVHGTNLRIEHIDGPRHVTANFKHHQTYGFMPYLIGDTVAFVNPTTMQREAFGIIAAAEMNPARPREVHVTLKDRLPDNIVAGTTCIENMTWTPTLHVSGCTMARLSTRGILATTPRKVVIEHNRFDKLPCAGVLIEADAKDWYESGPVRDVTIRNNEFIDCGYNNSYPVGSIVINPSNTVVNDKNMVHKGVRIYANRFEIKDNRPVLYAKSTGDMVFRDNTVEGTDRPLIILQGCADVTISNNNMPRPDVQATNCRDVKVR